MHYTKSDHQKLGDQYIAGPPTKKLGGDLSPPVPMVVAPMYCGLILQRSQAHTERGEGQGRTDEGAKRPVTKNVTPLFYKK